MTRVVIRDENQDKLNEESEKLAAAFAVAVSEVGDLVRMKGPMPCAINRIAGYYRNQIILVSPSAGKLQEVLQRVRDAKALARNERIVVDVDPVSLL
jgi:primosomal protein N'